MSSATATPAAKASVQPRLGSFETIPLWAWFLVVPLLCHLGFSWIGFNPTDDGWMLAVARRLAEGELPHRDFIFVRPAFSALLEVPLYWWGGDHVIWISRLQGWLTLAVPCWIWSGWAAGAAPRLIRFTLYLGALLLCAHSFPVMGWHSIDGMLFCALAVLCLQRERWQVAFFLGGVAALCRQNFVLFPPLLLLSAGLPPSRWVAAGFWSAAPSLIYLGVMAAGGAAGDFWQQVWAVKGKLWDVAIACYLYNSTFWIGLVTGVTIEWVRRFGSKRPWRPWAQAAGLASVGVLLALALWRSPGHYHMASLALFGLVLGWTLAAWRAAPRTDRLWLGGGLAVSWTTAISIGYNSPALTSGILLLLLWRLLHLPEKPSSHLPSSVVGTWLAVLAAIAFSFSHARQTFPYRDRAVADLTNEVGEVLAGGAGLRTTLINSLLLEDLQKLTQQLEKEQRPYVIVTDFSAAWIRSAQSNLLPVEWAQETELGYSEPLKARVFAALKQLPRGSRVVVQKFFASEIQYGAFPIPDIPYYFLQNWVQQVGNKVGETPCFFVYELPVAAP